MLALLPGGVSASMRDLAVSITGAPASSAVDRRRVHSRAPCPDGARRLSPTLLPDVRARASLRAVGRSAARVDRRSPEGACAQPGTRSRRGRVRLFRPRAVAARVVGRDRAGWRAGRPDAGPADASRAVADVLPLQAPRPRHPEVADRIALTPGRHARTWRLRMGARRQDPARKRRARRHWARVDGSSSRIRSWRTIRTTRSK